MATILKTSDRDRERMRRSAVASDQGPTAEIQSGAYPRAHMLDVLGDPQDPTRVTFPFLRRMRRDHMVSMGLHFIAMPVVKAPWYYISDNAQVAAFADNLIRPIYGRLVLTILRMLWAGYSPAAKNFETVNPAWTYLPGPGQDSKRVWDQGNIDAVIYKPVLALRPESCLPIWDSTGNFNGIRYDPSYGGYGYFVINGIQKPNIDLLHSLWAVHDQDNEDGSIFGMPRIAHCAPIFHMFSFIWTLLGRAFENNADPGPTVRYPRDDLNQVDVDGNVQKPSDIALRIGRRKRSGSTVALPSEQYTDYQDKPTGKYKWDIGYDKVETNFPDLMKFVDFLEAAKLRALWIQETGIVAGTGAQSTRNTAQEFGNQRDESQNVLMGQIDQIIDDTMVRPAIAMNMPWFEGRLEKKTIGFGQNDEDTVRQVIQLIGQAPDPARAYGTLGVDIRRLVEARGFPMLDPAAQKKMLDEAAATASATPPPAVTPSPTQGRRALVTQTGFDRETGTPEMSYVQLESAIHLTADTDFVASLPRTDVFADRQVLVTTRALRTSSISFLSWVYNDFARYLGKQKSLNLDELLEQVAVEHMSVAGEELAAEDKITKAVDKIIASWRPRAERITTFSQNVLSALTRVYDRTAGLHLSQLGSSARVTSGDKVAATWLEQQGATLVSGVLETTRQQLADALAAGVRDGKSTAQIAKDIREHFDGFPESRAAAIARTEISNAYNYATAATGMAAGVKRAQLVDGTGDPKCKERNGKIVDLSDAIKQRLNHTNCLFFVRLLPGAAANLEIRYEPLDGFQARYDEDTETILLSPDIDREDEAAYLLALGDHFRALPVEEELVVS